MPASDELPDLPPLDGSAHAPAPTHPTHGEAATSADDLPDLPPIEEQATPAPTHGGFVEGLKAAGEGLARGVSAGLSDLAETKLGISTPEDIAARKAEHPYVAGATELAGFAAPAVADFLSAGTLTPEIAAAEVAGRGATELAAQTAAKTATKGLAARALEYSPAGLIGKAGAITDRAVGKVLGTKAAGTALGRITALAAAGGVENAAFSAGNQISEDALGDTNTTADKLMAAAGHGAWTGLLLGGAIGAAGEVVSPLFRKASPWLDKQADIEAAKAVHPDRATMTEAFKRYGGAEAERNLGTVVRKYGLLGDTAAAAVGSDAEQIAERTNVALHDVGRQIGELTDKYGVEMSARDLVKVYDEEIAKAARTGIGQDTANALRREQRVLAEQLGYSEEPIVEHVKLSDAEKAEWIQKNKDEAARAMVTGDWPQASQMKTIVTKPKDVTIPLARIIEERQAIGREAFQGHAQAVSPHVDALRKIYGKLTELEEASIDKAARTIGGESSNDAAILRSLKKDYQGLKLISGATEKAAIKEATAPRLGIGAQVLGALGLVHGHLLAAPAAAFGAHFAGEKGSAVASHVLGKLSKIDLLARATTEVDKELQNATGALSGRLKPKLRLRRFTGPDEGASMQDKTDYAHEHSAGATVSMDQLKAAVPGLAENAPKTSGALVQKINLASQYLASRKPRPLNQPMLLDPTAKPRYSDVDAERYFEEVKAVHDPIGTLADAFESGHIGTHEIQAIKTTHPDLFAELQKNVLAELSDPKVGGKIPPASAAVIGKLFGIVVDPNASPESVAAFQAAYKPVAAAPAKPGEAPTSRPVAALGKVSVVKNLVQSSELPLEKAAAR